MSPTPTVPSRDSQIKKSEIDLSPEEIQRFSDLLLKRCGLRFAENRHVELAHGIRHAFAASTCATLSEFYALVESAQAGAVEMDLLINSVTVSETHFFRDEAQFNALYNEVLPQIINRKRFMKTLRLWSAGCASGEEPYSLAILLRELLPDIEQWSITILATDINTASIERARQAVYGNWAFREERSKTLRQKYFVPTPNSRFQLKPEIQRMVTFAKLNLAEPCYPAYDTNTMMMDLIICRNVTIYFSEAITRWVVDRFYDGLLDGGWLVVGHSEPSMDIYRRFKARNFLNTVLYQRSTNTSMLRSMGTRRLSPSPFTIPKPPEATNVPTPLRPDVKPDQVTTSKTVLPTIPENVKQEGPLEHARELLDYGRSEDACSILLALAKHQPGNAVVYALLGQAFANLGNWQEAEGWCRSAIQQSKLLLDAYYTLALVLQHQGKLNEAIENMKKVVYIDHNNILGHYGLATLYYECEHLQHAQKSLANAFNLLRDKPNEGAIPGSQGITYGRLRSAIISQQQAWSL